jgi:hypothetical protein
MKLSTPLNAHRRGSAAIVVILVLVIAIVVGGCVWLVMTRRPSDQQPGRLTAEAEAYFPFMSMNGFDMKATESFSQQQLVEITGKVTNKGNREVKTVDAVCLFYDPYGKALHRERVNVLKPRDGPLKPGETRAFRMAFDTIPQGWNQAFPQIGIAEMTFVQ